MKILITGMTGNVGSEVAHSLYNKGIPFEAGVRNLEKAKQEFGSHYEYVEFDFLNPLTFVKAFENITSLFLVRPPALGDFQQIKPVIDFAVDSGVKRIVFLSLMGIERNPIPPHYKIEKYIRSLNISYTFLRPGFFMQNLNQAHCQDIKDHNDIYIPAGHAKVSFIDARDIGEIAAKTLSEPGHENKSYTLTGKEALRYNQVAAIFSYVLKREVTYSNPSPLRFRKTMIDRGVDKKFVNVMVGLYLTTRMGMAKAVTPDTEVLLGRSPRTVTEYVRDYSQHWEEQMNH